jgi:hypothetical protein
MCLLCWLNSLYTADGHSQNSQGWTYPDSLYFTYTTLLTIGYGDFYPNTSAGKPFFVLWSLISIPAMTVLISNMSDTVVKLVQDITLWISERTILPERHTQSPTEQRNKKGKRRQRMKHRHGQSSQENEGSDQGRSDLEHDIEHVGDKIEKFEQDEGTPNSLAARLAREISHLASDLSASPPKKYSWDEWARWLDMLGERSDGSSPNHQDETETNAFPVLHVDPAVQPPPKARSLASVQHDSVNASGEDSGHGASSPRPGPSPITNSTAGPHQHQTQHQNQSCGSVDAQDRPTTRVGCRHAMDEQDTSSPGCLRCTRTRASVSENRQRNDWRWTWLSDEGPLFSQKTETEWIMERLCFRLEEVMEDEIREARGTAADRSSSPPR